MKALKTIAACCVAIVLAALLPLPASPPAMGSEPPGLEALPGSEWAGVYIIDLTTGREVVSSGADRLMTPASITKALTAASVLSLNDSASRFVTTASAIGPVYNKVLGGNVLVLGSGDPTLGSPWFAASQAFPDSVALALQRMGVSRVEGRVIVEPGAFIEEPRPAGWLDTDYDEPYGANLFAANWQANRRDVSRTVTSWQKTGRKGRRRKVTRQVTEVRSNPSPADSLAAALTRALIRAGIAVDGRDISPDGPVETLHINRSPRYVDILRSLMVRSDNLMAEAMLRTLAPGESRAEALEVQAELWHDDAALPLPRGTLVEDGSGLSRHNAFSPRYLGNVLAWMSLTPLASSYVRLFPRAGVEGTVRNFMAGTPLEGRLALKSGSMNGVQTYAGYLLGPDGRPTHAIVLMANAFDVSRAEVRRRFATLLLDLFAPSPAAEEPSDTISLN